MFSLKKKKIDDISLSFYQSIKGNQVIVLLHGWGASKEKLLSLGKALSKKGWQVFIPDLPGFGKSSLPPKPWGVSDYANFVIKTIDKLNGKKKVYLFGHSFGGRLAIKIASLYPNKIAGIVLCGSAGISRSSFLKRGFFLVLTKIGKIIFPKSEKHRQLIYKLTREHDYEKTKGVMRETFKLVISEDLKPLLPKIKTLALILWGTKDKMTRYADARIIAAKVKYSKLVSFPGLGHKLPYEKPELLAEKITEWRKNK